MIGTTLSHYTIEAELGRGGMGIVYKARDSKLDRTVAIKVLPSAALASKDDRERFYREAKSAAQLHHPNIASVFEIDEAVPEGGDTAEPRPFIAMEYIAGGTLQEKIQEKPLSLPDAVKIASQVAEALKAAHAKDIVHRDIKSANVMITGDGVAKVLDFGLAKTNQSTMLTRMGSTLGTVSYMSPEQARGQDVDGRTDLYSLGTMLYEMVAGRLPFAGEYEQAVVYSILNEPPEPLTSLRTGVPMQLEWIVNKLMAKDADYRYQTAADLLADLKALDLSGSGMTRRSMPAATAASMAAAPAQKGSPIPGYVAVAAALILGVAATWWLKPEPTYDPGPVMRASLDLGIELANMASSTVSPSGKMFAYSDFDQIWIRNLETGETWQIPESSGTLGMRFNADESWLVLERPGRIDRVQVRGGKPVLFTLIRSNWGSPSWTNDNSVLYESAGDLYVQSLSGGEPVKFSEGDSLRRYDDPFITPDGEYVLALTGKGGSASDWQTAVFRYQGAELLGILPLAGLSPKYLESGHMVYTSEEGIMAVAADLDPPMLLGAPVPLFENSSTANFSVSANGHLFLGDGATMRRQRFRFLRLKPDGTLVASQVEAGAFDEFRIAPNAPLRVVAEQAAEDGGESLWVFELDSGLSSRLTFGDVGDAPFWHPSGDSILYVDRSQSPGNKLILRAADGTGAPRVLFESDRRLDGPSADASFSRIAVAKFEQDWNIVLLDLETGAYETLIDDPANQFEPELSHDGRFVAFTGTQVGDQPAVYMQGIADQGRHAISRGIGHSPRWSPDGHSIYYQSPEGIFRVDVSTTNGRVVISNPLRVDEGSYYHFGIPFEGDDIIVLTSRQIVDSTGEAESPSRLVTVRFNWTQELNRLVPRD